MENTGPTPKEIAAYVQRRWVERSLPFQEGRAFVRRCWGTPSHDLLREAEGPHREAWKKDFEHRRQLWRASEEAAEMERLLREKTDNVDEVTQLLESASMTGASYIADGTIVDVQAWADHLYQNRDRFDLLTELTFPDIVKELTQDDTP